MKNPISESNMERGETPRTFHFISGLPRSGSTLLATILRQNPRFADDAFWQAQANLPNGVRVA